MLVRYLPTEPPICYLRLPRRSGLQLGTKTYVWSPVLSLSPCGSPVTSLSSERASVVNVFSAHDAQHHHLGRNQKSTLNVGKHDQLHT